MVIANDKSVLGKHVNGALTNIAGWVTTGAMFVAAIALVIVLLR